MAGALALALLVYIGYNRYDEKRAGSSGDVFANDGTRPGARDRAQASEPESEHIVYPSGAPAGQAVQPAASTEAEARGQMTQGMQPTPAHAPGDDTMSPNPPNGMLFGGSGRFQLYRQGNITWRLDTETGKTCIIFATNEEWKKPQVYRAGCGH
jgi:hypothetical protein